MFAYSETAKGPWIGEYARPDLALGAARGMYGNKTVYVAVVRPIKGSDGLPPIMSFIGDVREILVERYGSGADEFFDNRKVLPIMLGTEQRMRDEFDALLESAGVEPDFMVPTQVKAYAKDRHAKETDFK